MAFDPELREASASAKVWQVDDEGCADDVRI
jgi:hypothetical protein